MAAERRRTLAVGLSALALMSMAPAAFADARGGSNGGFAEYTSSTDRMKIVDDKCDNHPVYVQYAFINSGSTNEPSSRTEIDHNGGCGTSAVYDLTPRVDGRSNIVFRHCTDDFPPDSCGAWKNTRA